MTSKHKVTACGAYWDTQTDPQNPGWLVDLELDNGDVMRGIAPHPDWYNAGPDHDPQEIAETTARWEGFDLDECCSPILFDD